MNLVIAKKPDTIRFYESNMRVLMSNKTCYKPGERVTLQSEQFLKFNMIANLVLCGFQLCVLITMLCVARIVYKFVGWNDKTMLSMVFALNLEVFSKLHTP